MKCSACCSAIADMENFLRCTVNGCNKIYHQLCTGGKIPSSEDKKAWICPECRCASKKGGDNTLTPVGTSKKFREENVTFRKKIPPASLSPESPLSYNKTNELSSEIRSLKLEMATLREQLTNAVSLITRYETKLESYALQVVTLNTKLDGLEKKESKTPTVTEPSPLRTPTLKKPPRGVRVTKQTKPMSLMDSDLVIVQEATKENSVFRPSASASSMNTKESARIDQQWTEVRKRKNRGPSSLCGTAGPTITTLKAVEAVRYLHLWNMASSADEVLQYMQQLCSTESCTVEELTAKGSYKSYKIGVPAALYDKCYAIDVWPVNARIKAWINYKKPAAPARVSVATGAPSADRQPFRGVSSSQ